MPTVPYEPLIFKWSTKRRFHHSSSEGTQPAETAGKKGEKQDLLKDLLDNQVITQEEYDALVAAREGEKTADAAAEDPAASEKTEDAAADAANQNTESTQEADETTGA